MPNMAPSNTTTGLPGWMMLVLGCAVLFMGGGSRFALGLLLKPMTVDLDWGRALVSLLSTVFMVVSAGGQLMAGRLMDRYNPLWVIGTGLVLSGLGISGMGAITTVWQAVLVYGVLFALGQAASSVSAVGVMVSRAFGRRKGMATSVAMGGSALGQLVILTLLASVLAGLGWRLAYGLLGAAHGMVVIALLVLLRQAPQGWQEPATTPQPTNVRVAAPGAHAAGGWHIALLVVVYTICGIQDFFVSTHVVAFATDHGFSSVVAGNILALMGLMGLLGVLSAGVLADAYGPVLPTLGCFAVRMGLFGYIPFLQDGLSIMVFALLYGATFLVTAPLTVLFAERAVGPARMGSLSGFLSMVHQIAGGIGALFGGSVFDRWGSYNYAFGVMLVLAVVATAATWLLRDGAPGTSGRM